MEEKHFVGRERVDEVTCGLSPFSTEIQENEKNSKWKSEKAMAPHASTLAWKIPWMEETGVLQAMGLHRVGHD